MSIARLIRGRSDEKDVFSVVNALIDAIGTGSRVFVATVTGPGPWDFADLNGDEDGLIGYDFEPDIIDPPGDVQLRFNGDAAAHYGDTTGIARNQATIAINPGGPPGGARGVVEVRGVAAGAARTIGVARMVAYETGGPGTSPTPGDYCWTGIAALASARFFDSAGAADPASSVTLYKVMSGA